MNQVGGHQHPRDNKHCQEEMEWWFLFVRSWSRIYSVILPFPTYTSLSWSEIEPPDREELENSSQIWPPPPWNLLVQTSSDRLRPPNHQGKNERVQQPVAA